MYKAVSVLNEAASHENACIVDVVVGNIQARSMRFTFTIEQKNILFRTASVFVPKFCVVKELSRISNVYDKCEVWLSSLLFKDEAIGIEISNTALLKFVWK
jgi:hypothetical protein